MSIKTHEHGKFGKIGQSDAKILTFFNFSKWRATPSWIFKFVKFHWQTVCSAPTPYDSSAANDNTDGDASSQWSMSPGLPSNASSQQAYDPTITAYNDVDYVATSQPSPTG